MNKEDKTLENKVFEALGEVSMCWSETPKGVFDSTKAKEIGDRLIKEVNVEIEVYRKIAYEIAKSQTGKFLLTDVNLLPHLKEGEKFDVEKLMKIASENNLQWVNTKPSLKEAVEVLYNDLREDTSEGSYYHSWVANIAMSVYDEWSRLEDEIGTTTVSDYKHQVCNQGAKNFLNLLILK